MLTVALLLIVPLLVYALWTWKRQRMMTLAAKVPAFPGARPIVGHAFQFMGDSVYLLEKLKEVASFTNIVGGVSMIWLQMTPHYVLTNPKDAAIVLNTYLEKNYIYDFLVPFLGRSIFTASGSIWKQRRRMLSALFGLTVVNDFQGLFDRQSRRLVDSLAVKVGTGSFNLFEYINRNTFEGISEAIFGSLLNGHKELNEEYMKACHDMIQIVIVRFSNVWIHSDFMYNWTQTKKEQDKIAKLMNDLSQTEIEKSIATFKKNHLDKTDNKLKPFLEMILDITAKTGTLSDNELREEVNSMMIAGTETTPFVLLYTIIMIGSHPKVQDRLYEEIQGNIGGLDRAVEKEDTMKMVYLEAVINETLRLFPIVPMVARKITHDLQLTNYTVPAGSFCFVSFWGIHYGPQWGPDAHEFKPDRWLDPASMPENPAAFGGFSIGKRMCLGKIYAMKSMKTTIAHILRRYRVSADHTRLKIKLDAILRPVSGHYVALEAR